MFEVIFHPNEIFFFGGGSEIVWLASQICRGARLRGTRVSKLKVRLEHFSCLNLITFVNKDLKLNCFWCDRLNFVAYLSFRVLSA